MTYEHIDVLCWYVDLGRDYGPLIERMTASAKRVMPGCRTVLLTPERPAVARHFDLVCEIPDASSNPDFLCLERGRVHVSWMALAERPAILTDPDIEFLGPAPFDHSKWDIGLNWRTKADQPVNSGVVLAQPGHKEFWMHYGKVTANLPKPLWPWWCDQLAFSLMTGVCHKPGDILNLDGARVALLPAESNCVTEGHESNGAWAKHYKGQRKGPGWEKVFRSDDGVMPDGLRQGGWAA